MDFKLHVDDPVGAVAVHCANGIWGTVADGLFNTSNGLFYGGGFYHLGVQCMGVVAIGVYTVLVMFIVFKLIDKTIGLRVSAEEEIIGLDVTEHALASAYADFLPQPQVHWAVKVPIYQWMSRICGPLHSPALRPFARANPVKS